MLKYPEGLSQQASRRGWVLTIACGDSALFRLRLAMALSTLVQAVFCVSTAPTMISNAELPGHQFCFPLAAKSLR